MNLSAEYGLKKGDFVIIALILAFAAAIAVPFLFAPTTKLTAEIVQGGQVVQRVQLGRGHTDTLTLSANGITNFIQIEEDGVYFSRSDCTDQLCVHTGKLTRAGQIAVCLPTRVVVRLLGQAEQIDGIAN